MACPLVVHHTHGLTTTQTCPLVAHHIHGLNPTQTCLVYFAEQEYSICMIFRVLLVFGPLAVVSHCVTLQISFCTFQLEAGSDRTCFCVV